jgi:hypothetical protein
MDGHSLSQTSIRPYFVSPYTPGPITSCLNGSVQYIGAFIRESGILIYSSFSFFSFFFFFKFVYRKVCVFEYFFPTSKRITMSLTGCLRLYWKSLKSVFNIQKVYLKKKNIFKNLKRTKSFYIKVLFDLKVLFLKRNLKQTIKFLIKTMYSKILKWRGSMSDPLYFKIS